MEHRSKVSTRVAAGVAWVALLAVLAGGSGSAAALFADPGSAGDLPFVGRPFVLVTPGCVMDAQRQGVAGMLVVVTAPGGGVVAACETGEDGEFVLQLPAVAGLELSLLGTPVTGVSVTVGEPILIVLP
jgi:hypothetical protein